MNILTIVFLYFALINGTVFVQSQFAQWPGTFSVVTTDANTICNQKVCCCMVDLITITQAALSISWTTNITGVACDSDTTTTATFPIPSGYVIVPTTLSFIKTDVYVITLSSDSNTLSINDTTNEQCTSIAQRVTIVSTTTIIATGVSSTPVVTATAIVSTNPSATTTVGTPTSSSTNGCNTLRQNVGFNSFLFLLVAPIAYAVGN